MAEHVDVLPSEVHEVLGRHVLTDGMKLVVDLKRSRGSRLVDARNGKRYLDLYTFFASAPLGINPPGLVDDPTFMAELAEIAANKPANPDMYTHGVRGVRRDLRPGARRPGAAPPVLRRGRRAGGRERAQGRLRLEEPAERGGRPRPASSAPRSCT